jgi:MYXO-CTERM domain-containing protein
MLTSTNSDYYGFHFFMPSIYGDHSETLFDLRFTVATAPAPGAIALLGLAGVTRRRRRRQG